MQQNLQQWERVASVAAGVGALVVGLRRGGVGGAVSGATGAGLVARGLSGYCPVTDAVHRADRGDTREALGGTGGVFLRETITIDAPPASLYAFWRNPENLPRVMPHLDRVERFGETRSRWTISGPAGAPLSWDAEVINDVPGETIAWRSLPGADVVSAGSVRFTRCGRGTTIVVTMQYAPPVGRLGAAFASLFGSSPARQVREALRRLKHATEAGAPTVAPTVRA